MKTKTEEKIRKGIVLEECEKELKEMIKHYFPNLKEQNKDVQKKIIKILKDLQKEKHK